MVIKVEATGLCRSDWHGWMGHDPDISAAACAGPRTGRHGRGGRQARSPAGRPATASPCRSSAAAATASNAHSGNHQVCEQPVPAGLHRLGLVRRICRDRLRRHQSGPPAGRRIDFATAASLGCRFVTSFRAIVDQGRVQPGEWVAVHGCGGVGLSAIMIASAMGANVVAIDLTDEKLDFARADRRRRHGQCVRRRPNVVEAVREITRGGAHVSIDALGHPTTCFNSIANLRRRGRHVQVGLMLGEHAQPQIPMDKVIAHELEILGSHGMQAFRYQAMMDMIQAGKLQPQKLIGKTISLEQSIDALMNMDKFEAAGVTVVTKF